jgi:hypothetical protein
MTSRALPLALLVVLAPVACTDGDAPPTTDGSVFLYATELTLRADRVQYLFVVDDDPGEEAARLRAAVAAAFRDAMRLAAIRKEPDAWRPVDIDAIVVHPSGHAPHATSPRFTWRADDADPAGAERLSDAVDSELARNARPDEVHAPLEAASQAWKELALAAPERRAVLLVATTREDESPLPTAIYAVSSYDRATQTSTDTALVAPGLASDENCRIIPPFGKPTPALTRV